MARRTKKNTLALLPLVTADIESLDQAGRGVTHIDGKTVFVTGALPGENVRLRYTNQKARFDEAELVEILTASADRVEPKCPYSSVCGGCSLQHLDTAAQVQAKTQVLLDNFDHIGKVKPETLLPAITGSPWGYRRKARIGVRYVTKKSSVLVGFRETAKRYIADIESCEILTPLVSGLIRPLRDLFLSLSIGKKIAQVEVVVADNRCLLVLRVLAPPSQQDNEAIIAFADKHEIEICLQPGGLKTIQSLTPKDDSLYYKLDAFNLQFNFGPTDFTQINSEINQHMVVQALQLLQPQADDYILDMFCGIGNFTLPVATTAGFVVGIDGDDQLINKAAENAQANQLENTKFYCMNLFADGIEMGGFWPKVNKLLLDPPRTGCREIINQIRDLTINRIVYVSCNPATLARDAGILVNDHGYQLKSAGVLDMFPHTAHIESMALFER